MLLTTRLAREAMMERWLAAVAIGAFAAITLACNALPRPVQETVTPAPAAEIVRVDGWTEGVAQIPVDTASWVLLEDAASGLALRYPADWSAGRQDNANGSVRAYSLSSPSHARLQMAAAGLELAGGGYITLRVYIGAPELTPKCADAQSDVIGGQRLPICWEFRAGIKQTVLGRVGGTWDNQAVTVHMLLVSPFDLTDEATLRAIVKSIEFPAQR